jgi:hypothetical protein
MRIVHLSDIHLDKNHLQDVKTYVVPSLIKDLSRFNSEIPIDLVLFSGDLIDRGGASFGNVLAGLQSFEETIINPMSEALSLKQDRIFFAPGNHDIDRKADNPFVDLGLSQSLINVEAVNAFIHGNNCVGIERMKDFKFFEDYFYATSPHVIQATHFQSSFSFVIDDLRIGLTCFNSAWRCYDRESDKKSLIVGEPQVSHEVCRHKNRGDAPSLGLAG